MKAITQARKKKAVKASKANLWTNANDMTADEAARMVVKRRIKIR